MHMAAKVASMDVLGRFRLGLMRGLTIWIPSRLVGHPRYPCTGRIMANLAVAARVRAELFCERAVVAV